MAIEETNTNANPRYLDLNGRPYTPSTNSTVIPTADQKLDKDWLKQSFLIADSKLEITDNKYRYFSTAALKFTDTRMGSNIGVNARPQYTRYSDIRVKGRLSGRNNVTISNTSGNYGMGRYYSESEDDNSQTIYLRFGVPQYNSLTNFVSNAFDAGTGSLARTGRGLSTWFTLGKIVGTYGTFTAFPVLTLSMIGLKLCSTLFSRPTSKFYTIKPTMHLYWSAVNMLTNMIAINKGLMPRYFEDKDILGTEMGGISIPNSSPYKVDLEYLAKLHQFMPDMFNDDNGIDVYAVANRAQRIANKVYEDTHNKLQNSSSSQDYVNYVTSEAYSEIAVEPSLEQQPTDATSGKSPKPNSLVAFLLKLTTLGTYYYSDDHNSNLEVDPKQDTKYKDKDGNEVQVDSTMLGTKFGNFFDSEWRMGSQFATFKVDHTGSVTETFSNAVTESDLSSKLNGMVSQARETKFSFANGNVGDGQGGVMDTIQSVIDATVDATTGLASGATLGVFDGLLGLAGGGYIDIPKKWQSSSAMLPRSTYNIQLVSPYGNIISQMQNIFIPLAMLLAGTLPLSTGKQSYTSPFLVQLYDKGRCQIQTGIIESLSITRGTTNLPFNNRGTVMAIDVNFTIADLSTIMHMPVSTGSIFNGNVALDEDNILMDYLAVLAGQDLYSQILTLPKAKLNLAKRYSQFTQLKSPAYWASLIHEETTTGLLNNTIFGAIGRGIQDTLGSQSIFMQNR